MTTCEAWDEEIDHPAIGEPTLVVENPEYIPPTEGYFVTAEKLWKWTWVGGPVNEAPVSPLVDPSGWNEVGWSNDGKGRDNPDTVVHTGKPGKGNYFFYQTIQTWVEGTEAVGEPTMVIDNPDYIPGWTEILHHEDTCVIDPEPPTEPEEETPTQETPVVTTPTSNTPQTVAVVETTSEPLPNTGSVSDPTGLLLAAALLLSGAGLLITRKLKARA